MDKNVSGIGKKQEKVLPSADCAGAEWGLSKTAAWNYMMFCVVPVRYSVRESWQWGEYDVSDGSGKVSVHVKFHEENPSACYVFYLDGADPVTTDSETDAALRIGQAVDRKLDQWIGNSNRRKIKVIMLTALNRMLQGQNIPMALISPDSAKDPEERKRRRMQLQEDLNQKVRTLDFGYYQIRGRSKRPDQDRNTEEIFYILYGKANKKSEQLLKTIATELGKKYGQRGIGFRDLTGHIHYTHISADGSENDTGTSSTWEKLEISAAYTPIERFVSTSLRFRRRQAFKHYCDACWDEESQTYRFDHRYQNYF